MIVCEEMKKLRKLLDEKNIAWEDHSEILSEAKEMPMWYCRTWFELDGKHWSAINGFATYGGWFGANDAKTEEENLGLLELYNGQDEPYGWLTAVQVMEIIVNGENYAKTTDSGNI